ncbi:MAG TPA: tryptophan--tRNA ligase [Acidimicrobiales bacterium]|jgi:tryptophanyl-tRNA synthetase|nr:tryptophan--tRNA ligase [Acidimicrobiales bacterium]
MARVLSGIQPTGDIHLGNYLGAIRQWVDDQHAQDAYFLVVDLHALTVPRDPTELRTKTLETVLLLVAAGLDPDVCTLFVQSHVHEHAELTWILEGVASMGELGRMTQFKEKARDGFESARVALFTYPVLQAADILLYDADRVPVGEDQRQHLELCRDLAVRFNHRYGDTFVVPEASLPKVGARVMDLQRPAAKMSKSAESPQGTVLVLDDPATIERKFKRAVTDTGTEVAFDPESKPGVSNLVSILAAATCGQPAELAGRYSQYGPLKADTAEAVIELLRPIRERYAELSADPAAVRAALATGADKAQAVASTTLNRARDAIGLLPRG